MKLTLPGKVFIILTALSFLGFVTYRVLFLLALLKYLLAC